MISPDDDKVLAKLLEIAPAFLEPHIPFLDFRRGEKQVAGGITLRSIPFRLAQRGVVLDYSVAFLGPIDGSLVLDFEMEGVGDGSLAVVLSQPLERRHVAAVRLNQNLTRITPKELLRLVTLMLVTLSENGA